MTKPGIGVSAMDAIHGRRSVRAYTPQRLDQATIHTLLAAAVRAPTAIHEEPWAFVILQDADMLKRVSDHAKGFFVEEMHRAHLDRGGHTLAKFEQPDFNIFYDAGTLIVICGRTFPEAWRVAMGFSAELNVGSLAVQPSGSSPLTKRSHSAARSG